MPTQQSTSVLVLAVRCQPAAVPRAQRYLELQGRVLSELLSTEVLGGQMFEVEGVQRELIEAMGDAFMGPDGEPVVERARFLLAAAREWWTLRAKAYDSKGAA